MCEMYRTQKQVLFFLLKIIQTKRKMKVYDEYIQK